MNSISNYERIPYINKVLKEYFSKHPGEIVLAKALMDDFMQAGIFKRNDKSGKPIFSVLKELDEDGRLDWIPYAYAERKNIKTTWYFKDICKCNF